MAQLVEIDNIWSGPQFCCPVCGNEVYGTNGEGTSKPCEHLLFSWIDQVGEYENSSTETRKTLKQLSDEDGYEPSPYDDEFLNAMPESSVLFALTEHGFACGPVSLTIIHGICFPCRELDP